MNIMLDLETLGTKPGSIILSIAAVPFSHEYGDRIKPFYSTVNVFASKAAGLKEEKEAVDFWKTATPEARFHAFSGEHSPIYVLEEFRSYCQDLPTAPIIWGNGADFDNVLLAAAYTYLGLDLPWNFRNNRCYRTLKNLFPWFKQKTPEIKHHALHDATAQADNAETILSFMELNNSMLRSLR